MSVFPFLPENKTGLFSEILFPFCVFVLPDGGQRQM
jgi:hypothetical protein